MKRGITRAVNAYIESKKPGWVFSARDFAKISSNTAAIERTLSRLKMSGEIKRLRKGLYYKPIYGQWGEVPPETKEIVRAIERSLKTKIMPSGAAAANMLNLTTQVPAKTVFYTIHSPSNVKIGNFNIEFKKISPAKLTGRGKKVGLILNAMNYLGEKEVGNFSTQMKIAKLITEKDSAILKRAAKPQSKWLRESVKNIIKLAEK